MKTEHTNVAVLPAKAAVDAELERLRRRFRSPAGSAASRARGAASAGEVVARLVAADRPDARRTVDDCSEAGRGETIDGSAAIHLQVRRRGRAAICHWLAGAERAAGRRRAGGCAPPIEVGWFAALVLREVRQLLRGRAWE